MGARVLLLTPSTSYRTADFMRGAQSLGAEVIVATNARQTLAALTEGRTLTIDLARLEASTAKVVEIARARGCEAIVGTDTETTALAARASQALGLPHHAPEAVAVANDKYRFRRATAEVGLRAPESTLIPVSEDPEAAAARVPYPCVLKPRTLSGSRGVIRADDPSSFCAALSRIRGLLARIDGLGDEAKRTVLVERFIEGVEVALEGVVRGGALSVLALFDKPDRMDGPYFEETIYATPSRLSPRVQQRVEAEVARCAGALGLSHGPIHAEARIDDRGDVWLLEVAPRSIGGLCSRSLRFVSGESLEALILLNALGAPIPKRSEDAAGVMMMPIAGRGVLTRVSGLEAARSVAGIEEVTITIPVGDEVVPLPEGDRYLGFIFARAATPERVETALREAHQRIEVAIRG